MGEESLLVPFFSIGLETFDPWVETMRRVFIEGEGDKVFIEEGSL